MSSTLATTDPIGLGLPHRAPFLFVDRVQDAVPGQSAAGEKTFFADDPMFGGHFPGNPIVPGVIITEALAQLAGIAAPRTEGTAFLLTSIRAMKFPSSARPGERISLHACRAGGLGDLVQFDVQAEVSGRIVAKGQIVLARVKVMY